MLMHSAVAVTVLLRAIDASVMFNLGDNATATWYSPTMSSFIGPQPEDHLPATTAPFALFTGDLCDSGALPPATISGKVVVASIEALSTLHCTYETTYLNLYNSGAVAFIGISPDVIPGKGAFGHDGTRGAQTRSPPMLYVWTGPSMAEYQMMEAAAGRGYNATVFPDRNVWVDTYTSWYYQLFVRAIPGAVLLGAGAVAAVFFAVHLMNIAKRYDSGGSDASRSRNAQRHRITYIVKRIGIPQVTLMVEATTATAAGLGLAIGGLYSRRFSVLPYSFDMGGAPTYRLCCDECPSGVLNLNTLPNMTYSYLEPQYQFNRCRDDDAARITYQPTSACR